ncbi:MAG: 50S ribosomal protein L29 [Porticoccaceae bacterium]|jgi:large subunit ribosomal protein L29|nr:50S ribosomal protein L29 [Porticoccaceae bacterium]MEA3299447.1 50S ribosomal protein L29 [Pseudomonadota bacterium]
MKASELREKTVDELQAALNGELEAQFKLRMQHSTGQLGQSHRLGETRVNIARIKTVLNEKAGK